MKTKRDKHRILHRLLEFFLVGVVMGISEDMLAIVLATNEPITPKIFLIATVVAVPFAIVSELIVDLPVFRNKVRRFLKKIWK